MDDFIPQQPIGPRSFGLQTRNYAIRALPVCVLLLLSSISCRYIPIPPQDAPAGDPLALSKWVRDQIEYVEDSTDDPQSPRETLARGAGDCEDKAILFMWLLRNYGGPKSTFVGVDLGEVYHALVEVGGQWFDPTVGRLIDQGSYPERLRVSYDRTMFAVTGGYTR